MRIALTHIRQAWAGGTEGYLNSLAAYLVDQGHAVTIVCRRHQEAPHPQIRFAVLRPPTLGVGHRVWRFARDVDHHLDHHHYDLVYGLGRTWRQDVLRLGGGCHLSYLERSRPHTASWTQRYLGSGMLKHALYRWIERRTLTPRTRQTIVCNAAMVKSDIIARYGVPPERVVVIGNGVDLERFHPDHRLTDGERLRRACGIRDDEVVLLFLGSGYKRKGLDLLLGALPPVFRDHPEARLLVVGFDRQPWLFQLSARRLGIEGQVIFLGGRRDVAACYAASDLYILPTRYDPFANATLEALASGLPVITTAANGGSEILADGEQGSIVPPEVAPLRGAIRYWMDPVRRSAAAASARRQAERHSSRSKLAATLALLEEVAANRGAGPSERP
jgi:UDP-glucose:(heptosyl)LPS alpha-1,3-glucosyltransferase